MSEDGDIPTPEEPVVTLKGLPVESVANMFDLSPEEWDSFDETMRSLRGEDSVSISRADARWLCDWLHGEDVEHDYDRAHRLLKCEDDDQG